MNALERISVSLRHSALLRNADWLWDVVRPVYDAAINLCAPRGLPRVINGTDRVLISPKLRGLQESYEPEVWAHVMRNLRTGDQMADVGAFIGLYAVAIAKRIGEGGRVTAFEPDPGNAGFLRQHIALNHVPGRVRVEQVVVGEREGESWFSNNKGIQNQIVAAGERDARRAPMVSIDSYFGTRRLDIVKIDVEGFEEDVLKGANNILNDASRAPRLIYIEVHPYNWHLCGSSSESLLRRLSCAGYSVEHMDGSRVGTIDRYGEVVARRLIQRDAE